VKPPPATRQGIFYLRHAANPTFNRRIQAERASRTADLSIEDRMFEQAAKVTMGTHKAFTSMDRYVSSHRPRESCTAGRVFPDWPVDGYVVQVPEAMKAARM
jgi:hypothetical protein